MIEATRITGAEMDGSGRHIARMRVSAELLRQALCLPEGTKLSHFSVAPIGCDTGPDLECTVESDGLTLVQNGCQMPVVSPMLRHKLLRVTNGDETVTEAWIPEFDRWCQ